MTAATDTQKRETWRDWMPADAREPDRLYTRDELADRLAKNNIAVTAGDIRYWERVGILPRTVRRWHNGATRSTYPEWYGYLIGRIRQFQSQGYTLDQIRPRVRRVAEVMLGGTNDPRDAALRNRLHFWNLAVGPEDIDLPSELGPALHEVAFLYERLVGVNADRVELRVVDIDGGDAVYVFPVRPTATYQ